jgi:two-component system sensor histidine kinase AtoS
MYISLRIKIWVLLLLLIGGLGAILNEAASTLLRQNTQELFQTRVHEVGKSVSAYWENETNLLLRTAGLYAESEKLINFALFSLPHLLAREIRRLLLNSGFQELEIHLKSGLWISSGLDLPQRRPPLDPNIPLLRLSRLNIEFREKTIEMRAEVPINRLGEFIGRLTLIKKWNESHLKDMGRVLQSQLALAIRSEIVVSTLAPDANRDLIRAVYNSPVFSQRIFERVLNGKTHSIAVTDLGETVDREPIRMLSALSQEHLLSAIDQARRQNLNLTILAITVSLLVALLFSDLVLTRRLRVIRDGAQTLAGDNLSLRLPVSSRDELGDLVRSFNEMAEKLQEKHQSLILKNEEMQVYIHSLEHMKTYIQNILGSLVTGVITWNTDQKITTMNNAARQQLSPFFPDVQKLSLRRFLRRLTPATRAAFLQSLKNLLRKNDSGSPFDLEFSRGEHKGSETLQGSLTYLRDADQAAFGLILTLENITQRKIIEQQLFHADKLSSIGQLAASVAHEIKNPLASIKTLGQLLQEETPATDSRREYIDIIVAEVNRLNGVVEQLLKFARPEQSQFSRIDLREILQPVLALTHHEMERHRVKLESGYAPDLQLFLDPEKIKQVLLNLIFNAIQAMPSGGTIRFTATDDPQSPWTVLEISDTGIGMPPEVVQQVFDPFFTTKQRGTGLGLAIVKKIMDLHGGKIEVKSLPNQGTTFSLFLPRTHKTEGDS